jgi:hypothetical protein
MFAPLMTFRPLSMLALAQNWFPVLPPSTLSTQWMTQWRMGTPLLAQPGTLQVGFRAQLPLLAAL